MSIAILAQTYTTLALISRICAMAQSIEARIQAATPPLREIEEKFWEGGGDVAVVKLRDQLCTLLEHP